MKEERPGIKIRKVKVDEIINIRHRMLREGLPISTARWEGDEKITTIHFAGFLVDSSENETREAVTCVTFLLKDLYGKPAWQLRGMATSTEHQGRGYASDLVIFAEKEIIRSSPIRLCWCNARVSAIEFYFKHGWMAISDEFEIPTAGPHRKMIKQL